MATSAFLWNRVAKGYAKSPVADPAAYQRKLEITRAYFTPESDVMEFGCGTGTTAVSHAPFVRRIRAYDISEKMLEIGRSRAAEAGVSNISFEKKDIVDLDLPGAGFDVAMGHSILHLLRPKARRAVLAKVHRLLKPGGAFISSTVCLGEMKGLLPQILPPVMGALPLLPPVQALTRQGLRGEITMAGFAIDHDWAPDNSPVLFLVAKKAASATQAISTE
jgi:ubiquinone/menaquinone biosynthesis C-methylase UbiE